MGPRIRARAAGALAVCLALSAAPALAQSEAVIRGQLVAEADRSPLMQGKVTLSGPARHTSTEVAVDADGRFVFRNVDPGAYVIAGTAAGFSGRELRVVLEPREIRTVVLPLAVAGVEVALNVSGQLQELPSTHSPSSTVLASARIERLPISQQGTLPDVLVSVAPGMIRGHDDFVHVRGEEVALNPLINGVSFWENAHALFSSGLNPGVIETANVMIGGFSAEYGNRFGGVVDIVTKSGLRMDQSGSATFSAGDEGRRNVSAEFGDHRGQLGYYAFGSLLESDRFLSPPSPAALNDHARGGHGFFQLDADLGRRGVVRATLLVDGVDFGIPRTPQDAELRPQALPSQESRQQTAIVGWNRAWSNLALTTSFYQRWSRSDLSPAAGPLTAQAEQRRDLTTLGGKVDLLRFFGSHSVKAGIDVVRLRPNERLAYDYSGYRELAHVLGLPHIHITDNTIDFSGEATGNQVSAYLQDDVRLGERVTLDLGVRVDRYDLLLTETHASPRVNLAMRLAGGVVVHASYNHFFVPPPIEGALSSGAGLTARIREVGIALPPVHPTTENQFELGASGPVGPLQLALTGYYRASEHPVHTTVWPDARIYSYASFDSARAYGMEVKAEVPALVRYGVTGYLNYALGRVYFFNPVTGGFVTEAEHLQATNRFLAPMDQTHTLTGGVSYSHARSGLWLGTALEYGSGTPTGHGSDEHEHAAGEADHEDAAGGSLGPRVPGHFTGSLSLGVDLLRRTSRGPRLSLQVDVENLSGRSYLIAQEGEFTPGQYSIPRLVSLTARVRF